MSNLDNTITTLLVTLARFKGVSNVTIIKALKNIDRKNINTSFEFLKNLKINKINTNIDKNLYTKTDWKDSLQESQNYIKRVHQLGIHIVTFLSKSYPQNLLSVKNHRYPVILYVKGSLDVLNQPSLAIVGSRKVSSFSANLAKRYTKYFVQQGYVDIGGLALGTDSIAHRIALANHGKAIAIMGESLDQPVAPRSHTQLAKQIIQNGGALISTYPLGSNENAYQLVERDSWQSGMADGVLAVEAGNHSGTQHAMRASGKQGRPLGVPDYQQYKNAYSKLNYPTNNIPQSVGTQSFINSNLAYPLCSFNSVIKFNHIMKYDRKIRLSNLKKYQQKHLQEIKAQNNHKSNKETDKHYTSHKPKPHTIQESLF